jgi:LAO/AO transport system kinase
VTAAVDPAALAGRVLDGDRRALARLITMVERGDPVQLREVAGRLNPSTGQAAIVGVTGSPGVGKSTLCNRLVEAFRSRDSMVGVLAVDPSSPYSGGALLGDRVRMQQHTLDPKVFIRSMATRGHLGGLAWATPQAVRVLDAGGCDVVVVETAGVGQAEVEVAGEADTTLVVLAPGFGDAVQVAKAGILEVADILVVNKADRDGARRLARDLREMVGLGAGHDDEGGRWTVPIVQTVAERGDGVAELLGAIDAHRDHLSGSGELHRRRLARARNEIDQLAVTALRATLGGLDGTAGIGLDDLAEAVVEGKLNPYEAADRLLAAAQGPSEA